MVIEATGGSGREGGYDKMASERPLMGKFPRCSPGLIEKVRFKLKGFPGGSVVDSDSHDRSGS